MITIFKHEIKVNFKTMIIWALSVAALGFLCILMFSSMQEEMEKMSQSFANMGSFADAFGMSQLSIGTLIGYYATEIGTVFSLGGAMFAAIISTVMLSKEEDGHTGEFLYAFPIKRGKIVVAKYLAVVWNIVLFHVICIIFYIISFVILGESIPTRDFTMFHFMQLLMQIEISAICFFLSACAKKSKIGVGLGIAMLLYGYDLIVRVIPDLKNTKIITPFSYANAADIFSTGHIYGEGLILGMCLLVASLVGAYLIYTKRDLAS